MKPPKPDDKAAEINEIGKMMMGVLDGMGLSTADRMAVCVAMLLRSLVRVKPEARMDCANFLHEKMKSFIADIQLPGIGK